MLNYVINTIPWLKNPWTAGVNLDKKKPPFLNEMKEYIANVNVIKLIK